MTNGMNENRESPFPCGLIWLLIYQWILVLIALGYSGAAATAIAWNKRGPDVAVMLSAVLILGCWGIAMALASIKIMRRRSEGFLAGMICHLLLEVPGLSLMLVLGCAYVLMSMSHDKGTRAWAGLFLLFALMWLPFVVISAWAFFYLRRLRSRFLGNALLSRGAEQVRANRLE